MPRLFALLTALALSTPATALASSEVQVAQDALAVPDEPQAAEAPTAAEAQQREVRNAWIVFGSGVGITSAGIATLLVGRGNSGELNTEPNAVAEARSILGAGATIAGLTTILVGTVKLEQAWGGRSGKARTTLAVAPLRTPQSSSGLTLTLTR